MEIPLSKDELEELDRVINLPLSSWKKGFHWRHVAEYEMHFDRDPLGNPSETLKKLIQQARMIYEK